MFILNRQQVKFCQVVSSDAEPQRISAAIAFNGLFFTKGETFLNSEKMKARKRVQECLEAPQQLVILLEDTAELALYHLNVQARPAETQKASEKEASSSSTASSSKGMLGKLRRTLNQHITLNF
ncbi:MAG: hypothetical protein AB4058_07565 [Microcystaceae cyanobacterium]